jgi:YVTN family beta-propeller protein
MKTINKGAFLALALSTLFVACEKESNSTNNTTGSNVYVVNEGGFLKNNGSISSLNNGTASNNLFLAANGVTPGDVVQHIAFMGESAFIVANNSKKVEVVNTSDFISLVTIEDAVLLDYPRYAQAANGKMYVSNGSGAGKVVVIDTATNNILTSVAIGNGPGKMAVVGDKLFVINGGGYSTPGDTVNIPVGSVSVINTDTDVEATRTELFPNATDIVVDANNRVFVLCSGATVYNSDFSAVMKRTEPYLVELSSNGDIVSSTSIGLPTDKPSQLEVSADGSLYLYQGGEVFSYNNGVKGQSIITGQSAYGMNIGPDNTLYLSLAGDYSSNGYVATYSLSGAFQDSILVGVVPNGVYFD